MTISRESPKLVALNEEDSAIGQLVPVAGKPATWMRRTVHISGQIEPFFGTLDENVRLLEDVLHVRTHLSDTKLTIEGEHEAVEHAVKIVEEYNHATRRGRALSSEEVKALI